MKTDFQIQFKKISLEVVFLVLWTQSKIQFLFKSKLSILDKYFGKL